MLIKTGETISAFNAADWLSRWRANGNGAELTRDGRIWLTYGRRGSRRRRDALELELRSVGGAEAVKAWLRSR